MHIMTTPIDLSIIIVSWNTKDILLDCLKSMDQQHLSCTNEIIVVDNGSTDGSQAAVRALFPEVRIIENKANLGFAKANNIGISQSRGRYICLVNSDVVVLEDCFERLITFMEANPRIGISGPKTLSANLSIQNTCRKFPTLSTTLCGAAYLNRLFPKSDVLSNEHMRFFDHDSIRQVESLAGCCLMIRKEALDQVGLFDEQFFIYFEETDLCMRFRRAGWNIVFFPHASLIHYHGASSSQDPVRFNIEQLKSQMKYWKKHHNRTTLTIFQMILLMQHGGRLIMRTILYAFTPVVKKPLLAGQLSKHRASIKLILFKNTQSL